VIRKLRIKFIATVMTVAAVMLISTLGVVLYFTGENMQTHSVSMMRSVAEDPFRPGGPGKGEHGVRLPFFSVRVSADGSVIGAEGGYFDLSDRDYIQQITDAALAEEGETGRLPEYGLRYLKSPSPKGMAVIFADTATEDATMRDMCVTCLLIFFGAMLVFFGISILLARWAVRPVERAWEQQRQFVADASHELKTPLTVIMANAELLQSGEEDPQQRTFSENILSTSYKMRSLVESLLDMARIDSAGDKLELTAVDMSQLVSDAVLSFQLLYEEQGMALESAVAEDITLPGSQRHLYQVLDVLLDNALKYSTPGGPVAVTLKRSGRNCQLSVSGPGAPISREDLGQIFKRFYRADKARTGSGSYGLGLAIAQSVVTAHRGRIWAESTAGINTFHVQLPL